VAPSKNQERDAREARERLKRYTARQSVHAAQIKRRTRDNLLAALGVLVVVGLAVGAQVFYFTAGPGVPTPEPTATAEEAQVVPSPEVAENRTWTGELALNGIPLGIALDGALAPQAVASLVTDIQSGYYLDKTCHRMVLSEAMNVLQCGSLDGTGASDPSYMYGPIENAPADNVYPVASIAMARQGDNPDSQGRQFFIVFGPTTIQSDSAGGYTIVGTVTSGLDELNAQITSAGIVDGAQDGEPVVPTTITSATIQ